jgi:hypothetical protein
MLELINDVRLLDRYGAAVGAEVGAEIEDRIVLHDD